MKLARISADRSLISVRGLSLLLALGFALFYSKQLGVERRGLLTLVMTSNLVFSILLISGISLHLRNLTKMGGANKYVGNYILVVAGFSLFTPILNFGTLKLYEILFETNIPDNLFYVSLIYCFFSTLSYGFHDFLLLIKSVKLFAFMDISVILIQIAAYFTLVFSGETSYFVSVLIAITISYLVMTFSTLVLVLSQYKPILSFDILVFKHLFRESGSPYLLNLASQLLERLDKVFIGLQTSSADLGRYSTNQSIFGLLKFFPDSISKLSIARNRNYLVKLPSSKTRNFMLVFLIIPLTQAISELVRIALGPEWIIAWYLLISVAVIEIMRGFHNVVTTNIVRLGEFERFKQMTIVQIFIGVVVQPISVYFLGIAGSIIINFCILAYGLALMRKYVYA